MRGTINSNSMYIIESDSDIDINPHSDFQSPVRSCIFIKKYKVCKYTMIYLREELQVYGRHLVE